YRDAWSVGFDGKRTIGVWVGRPDGSPVAGLIGRVAAAPILFDAFARIGEKPAPLPLAPRGALFATSGKLPPPLRNFRPNGVAAADNSGPPLRLGVLRRTAWPAPDNPGPPLRIAFPPNNSRVEFTTYDGKPDPVALKITGGGAPLTVLGNSMTAAARARRPAAV